MDHCDFQGLRDGMNHCDFQNLRDVVDHCHFQGLRDLMDCCADGKEDKKRPRFPEGNICQVSVPWLLFSLLWQNPRLKHLTERSVSLINSQWESYNDGRAGLLASLLHSREAELRQEITSVCNSLGPTHTGVFPLAKLNPLKFQYSSKVMLLARDKVFKPSRYFPIKPPFLYRRIMMCVGTCSTGSQMSPGVRVKARTEKLWSLRLEKTSDPGRWIRLHADM